MALAKLFSLFVLQHSAIVKFKDKLIRVQRTLHARVLHVVPHALVLRVVVVRVVVVRVVVALHLLHI